MRVVYHYKFIARLIYCALVFASVPVFAQPTHYSEINGHSHNDYLSAVPFNTAFNEGFGSIEADVFPVNGQLLVAHDRAGLVNKVTLKQTYLEPLRLALTKDRNRSIKLLVDIKSDNGAALNLLQKEVEELIPLLTTPEHSGRLTILISGERPLPSDYAGFPAYFFFDDDLIHPHNSAEWKRVGQVSLNFTRYSKWNGAGSIVSTERQRLVAVVDSVHRAGKTIRFWGAPDSPASWQLQMALGVDLVGTDKIQELAALLRKRPARKS